MKIILNLRMFDGGHSITVYKGTWVSTAVVKNEAETETLTTDVPSGTVCKIVATYASHYQLDKVNVLAGGVSVGQTTLKFTMPDQDVVLFVTSKREGNDVYFVFDNGFSTKSIVKNGYKNEEDTMCGYQLKTGYELDKVEIVKGDATCDHNTYAIYVTMGEEDATVMATSKAKGAYIVTENITLNVNDRKLVLTKNTKMVYSASGAAYGIEYADGSATQIDESIFQPAIDNMIATGVLVKI